METQDEENSRAIWTMIHRIDLELAQLKAVESERMRSIQDKIDSTFTYIKEVKTSVNVLYRLLITISGTTIVLLAGAILKDVI